MKLPSAAVALAVLLLSGWLPVSGIQARTPDGKLIIGMELSYPPFEMTDTNNQPAGIGVELAKALAAYLHKEPVIQNTEFIGLIPALKTDKIDVAISSMTATDERRKTIDFSDPYMNTGICLLVGANTGIQSIADVDKPGRKVAVKSGTTGFIYAKTHFTQAQVVPLAQQVPCVLEVVQGKADAFIYDQMSVFQVSQRNPKTTRAILEPFQKESWAIGLRKGNDELRRQVNAFLADFKAKKGLEALGEKYITSDKEIFKQMGFPFSF